MTHQMTRKDQYNVTTYSYRQNLVFFMEMLGNVKKRLNFAEINMSLEV